MWFAKLGGKWDYVIEFFAENASEFDEILDKIVKEFEDVIKTYEVMVILEIYSYKRAYIYDNKKTKHFSIGGKIEGDKPDKIDLKIIKELKLNSQITNTEIGEKLHLSRNTIKQRINKMEQRGIIVGYKLFYHPQKIGYQSYKLLISMKRLSDEKEEEFFNYALTNPNIIFAHKNLSEWNYEFEIEIDNVTRLQEMIIELRTKFKDFILDYELFPILHDYRINLFPD